MATITDQPMRQTWTFHCAGQILFGRDAITQIGDIAKRLGVRRALVVTDSTLEKAGTLERVRGPLRESGLAIDVFAGGEPEPSMRVAEKCLEQARSFMPDAVVGLGGGRNMELAKI